MWRAVVLPAILLALLAAFFLWQINRLVAAANEVERADRILTEAHLTQKFLIDMETGVRGYLITGDQIFLEPYIHGERGLNDSFNRLDSLVRLSDQRTRMESLRAPIKEWRAYASDVVALRDAGGDYAARVGERTGKNLMDGIRARIDEFVKAEETYRDVDVGAAKRTTRNATFAAIAATLLLGGALAFNARRELLTLSTSYTQSLTAEQTERERLRVTLASIGDAVIATDESGRITFMNPVASELTKWSEAEARGRAADEIFKIVNETSRAEVESPVTQVLREGKIVGLANHTKLIAKDGGEVFIDDSGAPIKDADNRITGAVLVFRDISARRADEAEQELMRAEQSRMREERAVLLERQAEILAEDARLQTEQLSLRDELVRMQAARLAELSTPLIPVTNEIVIMPLIGTVDTERAGQVLASLSEGIVKTGARIAIIDITGVRAVDSHVASTLISAAQAVRLLGAEVVLTGIRPQVARTLVGLGINFDTLTTRSTLQRGIAYALAQLDANRQHIAKANDYETIQPAAAAAASSDV